MLQLKSPAAWCRHRTGNMEASVEAIDGLAQVIRQIDGSHNLGAAALAEAILNHPDTATAMQTFNRDQILERIARKELGVATLQRRGRDGLDFYEIGVISLKNALEAAYQAGREAAH